MATFAAALENSLLLKPWASLARIHGTTLKSWIEQSQLHGIFDFMSALKTPAWANNPAVRRVYNLCFLIGGMGLFVLMSFQSTGVIGAFAWLLLAYGFLGWVIFRPSVLSRITIVDVMVLAFVASAAVSAAFSSYVLTSFIGFGKMLTFFAGYVVFRILSEQGQKTIILLMGALIAVALGETLIGLYQHQNHIQPLATWTDPSINSELKMDRIFGTLQPSNPNLLAGFLVPCLAAATGLSLMFISKKAWPVTLILAGISALILVAIILTGSRGGYLAIFVMMASMFAYIGHLIWREKTLVSFKFLKPLWLLILIGSVVVATFGILSSEQLRHRVASIFAMREDSSISYRLNVYQSAARMVQDNPVVGIGPGNNTFKRVYGLYMVPGYNALSAYSVPLEIAVEQGFIGLLIFLSLLGVLKLRTAFLLDADVPLQGKLLAGTLLTGILGSFMYGIFDTIWYRPSVNLLFWFMVAALARETEAAVQPYHHEPCPQPELIKQ